jgi:autotransporter-associated beta strand protein
VGDSPATDIEVDFRGTLGQTGATDGQSTTIRKEGAGTMRISAANFFPRLHVAGGVLIVNHDQALGVSRTGGLTNLLTLQGGTLQAGGADRSFNTPIALVGSGTVSGDDVNLTLSGNISGSGGLVKSGTKTLVLAGTNNYTGNTAIDQGMLSISNTSALPGWDTAGRYSVADGATLTVGAGVSEAQVATMLGTGNFQNGSFLGVDTSDGDRSHASAIAAPIGLTKFGSGTLTLSGNNTYSGTTTILDGALKLGHPFGIGKVVYGGGSAVQAKGFALRSGTFDINGQSTYLDSWLLLSDITLGGVAGAEMTISGTGGGFGLHNNLSGNEARIIYDATNSPGAATISAAFSTSGSSSSVDRYIIVGDSSATDIEVDFTGTLGKVGHSDGRNTTIRKEGAGTMQISAANYFPRLHVAGGTLIANHDQALGASRTADGGAPNLLTLSGGTLQAAGADRSYAAAVSLSAGTTSTISGDDVNLTLSGNISGAGNLVKSGTKNLTLSGSNSYTGNTSINQGMLSIATTASLPGWNTAGRYSVADGATLTVGTGVTEAQVTTMLGTGNFQAGSRLGFDTTAGDRTHTPNISGAIGLTKLGSGTLTLSGDNSYTGTTIIEGGTLKLGHKFGIGKNVYEYSGNQYAHAKGFTLRNGTFDINGQVSYPDLNCWLVLDTITLGGQAGGEMAIIGSGGGFGLYSRDSYVGSIVYDATNNPGAATIFAPLSASGLSGTATRSIVVGDSLATGVELDFRGTLGQTAMTDGRSTTIRKEGAGTMQISAANYFPRLHVAGGTLIANHDQALGVSRTGGLTNLLTLQGGTLQAAGADRSFSTPITLYPGTTSTISGDDVNLALSGVIGGSGHLRKAGTKDLVLSGDNTYTGNTLVEAGRLLVNNTSGSGTGTGAVAVGPDGMLGGTGAIGGPVTIEDLGILAPGSSVGTLTLNNSLTLAAGSLFEFELGPVGQSDMVWMPDSELILNDQQFDDFTFTALSGFGTGKYVLFSTGGITGSLGASVGGVVGGLESALGIVGNDLVLTVVPEPSTLGLLAAGVLSLLACGRRKGMARA